MDRISRAKNRMRQSRSSGTVGGEGGNLLAYPANLIKLHKAQMASDRMSCHSATANQVFPYVRPFLRQTRSQRLSSILFASV